MDKLSFIIGDVFFGSDSFPDHPNQVAAVVSRIVDTLVSFAGAVFIVLVVVGGLLMIVGAGSGNPQKIAQGRTTATTGFIGFLVVVGAYLIVLIIQLMTGIAFL